MRNSSPKNKTKNTIGSVKDFIKIESTQQEYQLSRCSQSQDKIQLRASSASRESIKKDSVKKEIQQCVKDKIISRQIDLKILFRQQINKKQQLENYTRFDKTNIENINIKLNKIFTNVEQINYSKELINSTSTYPMRKKLKINLIEFVEVSKKSQEKRQAQEDEEMQIIRNELKKIQQREQKSNEKSLMVEKNKFLKIDASQLDKIKKSLLQNK